MKYKVMIVEDQAMPRELFELRIQASEHFETALSIDNAALADVYCLRLPVDLILMDVVTRGGESGLDAAAEIKRHMPHIKIVIVTSMADAGFLQKARQAGAESFWYKESSPEDLLAVMDRTMRGESVYPDQAPEVRIGNTTSAAFTPGDLAVLRLLVRGLPDAAIAGELHISVSAVRWHIKELFEKTGYTNRVSLACDVINKDLIVPGF